MKDEWLRAALTDDTVVVELLFRLKQSSSMPMSSKPPPLPLSWGQRLPRSKPANTVVRKDSITTTTTTTTRCSPTTPLSWSDGAYEESCVSRAPSDLSSASRSKGICTSEATNTSSIDNNRSRRKRTFTSLKEEECVLLKERIHLKRELASLHVTLKEQRARSETLKRFKVDLNIQSSETGTTSGKAEAMVSDRCNQMEVSTANHAQSVLPRHATQDDRALSNSFRVEEEVETNKRHFMLPDLNMMPTEEEVAAEVFVGN